MPEFRVKLSGFDTASPVGLIANGFGSRISKGSSTWGQAGSNSTYARVAVRKRNPGKFAPDGIFFEITDIVGFDTEKDHSPTSNAYEPEFHDIEVFWDFGDTGATYSAPVNTMTEHKDRNVMKGHQAAHVYRAAGDYTVTAFLVEASSGKTATATLTLSGATGADTDAVKDPETVFAGNKTIFVGTAENAANIPTDAVEVADMATFFSTYGALDANGYDITPPAGAGTGYRLMIAGGVDERLSDQIYVSRGDSPIYLCSEPSVVTRPILRPPVGSGGNATSIIRSLSTVDDTSYLIQQSIDIIGDWDPTTESTIWDGNQYAMLCQDDSECYFLADDVKAHRLTTAYGPSHDVVPRAESLTSVVHDCDIQDWANFGAYGGGALWSAILGSRITQSPDAMLGGPKFIPSVHNNHGPIRIASDYNCIIDGNDLFSNTGWSSVGTSSYGASRISPQPCIRLNTNSIEGAKYTVTRNAMEGGSELIGFLPGVSDIRPLTYHSNSLVEANLMTAGGFFYRAIRDGCGGATIRHNVMVIPQGQIERISGASFITFSVRDEGSLANDMPTEIYANTLLSQRTDDETPIFSIEPGGTAQAISDRTATISQSDNLLHEPDAPVPTTTYAPVSTTAAFPIRTKNTQKWRWFDIEHELTADIPDGGTLDLSYPSTDTSADEQADFIGSGHYLIIQGDRPEAGHYRGSSDITVTLLSSVIRITNNSGAVINSTQTDASPVDIVAMLDWWGPTGWEENPNPLTVGSNWVAKPVDDAGGAGVSAAIGAASATYYTDVRGAYISGGHSNLGAWAETA